MRTPRIWLDVPAQAINDFCSDSLSDDHLEKMPNALTSFAAMRYARGMRGDKKLFKKEEN